MASNQLEMANRMANQGKFGDALLILAESRRLAVSCDDPPLIIKTSIARGNFLFSMNRHDEAFTHWEAALTEAGRAGEKELESLAGIYRARARLMLIINSGGKNGVAEIRDEVNNLTATIKNDLQAQAAGLLVLGMAEKELGRYAEAEKAVRRAVEIHEKGRYLEETAYDWYFIASVYSVSQRYDEALSALNTAINFDRRAENGYGLASGWQAVGEVNLKKNQYADSEAAFRRAAGIYRAIGLEELAAAAEAKIRNQ